jgi:hypothetical protein
VINTELYTSSVGKGLIKFKSKALLAGQGRSHCPVSGVSPLSTGYYLARTQAICSAESRIISFMKYKN